MHSIKTYWVFALDDLIKTAVEDATCILSTGMKFCRYFLTIFNELWFNGIRLIETDSVSDVNETETKTQRVHDLDSQDKTNDLQKSFTDSVNDRCGTQKSNSLINRIYPIHVDNERYSYVWWNMVKGEYNWGSKTTILEQYDSVLDEERPWFRMETLWTVS